MFDLDHWVEVWHTIMQNKMRSILTAFGVFWGIFMLVVMMGFGYGISNGIFDSLRGISVNSGLMFTRSTSVAYDGYQVGRNWSLDDKDLEIMKQHSNQWEHMSGMLFLNSGSGDNVFFENKHGNYNVLAYDVDYRKIVPVILLEGRQLDALDMKEARKVCVIGERIKNDLFTNGQQAVGALIRVNGIYYRVVGVVKAASKNFQIAGNENELVSLPLSVGRKIAQRSPGALDCIVFSLKKDANVDSYFKGIEPIIKKRHHIAPDDNKAIMQFNVKQIFDMIRYVFMGIHFLIWFVGLGTLFAGAVGVSNIMLITVKERTQEIGVRRALGASPRNILMQILSESLVLTLMAGLLGITVGVLVLAVASHVIPPGSDMGNPQISFSLAIISLAVLSLFGLIAGWIPSKRALKIKAIDALRDE